MDAGEPRNAPAAHMQGCPSRDGMPAVDFLAAGREEVRSYGVEPARDTVNRRGPGGGFTVDLAAAGPCAPGG